MSEASICQVPSCMRPADGWLVCPTCIGVLRDVLAEADWMLTELETVTTMQTRYTNPQASKSSDVPLPINLTASDVRDTLQNALTTAARAIAEENSWEIDREASDWLLYRISAIRISPSGPDITHEIRQAAAAAMWIVDRPQLRQYLGNCADSNGDKDCPGRIYARQNQTEGRCDTCGLEWNADELRTHLMAKLEGRLCTAAEIARLSTYLGVPLDRSQVRKRINSWHRRGQITRKGGTEDAPTFRFGDALTLLARAN